MGTDAAGRRQYRYHDLWREQRDRAKHDRVLGSGLRGGGRLPRQHPAVARASYIDPRVIRHYENGRTIAAVLGDLGRDSDFGDLATRGRAESAVLRLLAVPAQPRTRSSKRS